jgi:DNA polymerase III alpha subunit
MLTALISIGFFSGLPETRQQMLDEFDTWSNITIKEAEWAEENFEDHDNLTSLLKVMIPVKKDGGAAFNSKRSQIMADLVKQCEKPSYSLKDDSEWVIRTEENYLGIALTYSRIEAHDISLANTTIKEFIDGKRGNIKMAVTVSEVKKYVVKKGKSIGLEMAFLCVEDTTGTMDTVTVFNDQWLSYKNILYEGNNIIMIGQDSKKKRYQLDDGFILNEVIELS